MRPLDETEYQCIAIFWWIRPESKCSVWVGVT